MGCQTASPHGCIRKRRQRKHCGWRIKPCAWFKRKCARSRQATGIDGLVVFWARLPLIPPTPFSHTGRRGRLGVLKPKTREGMQGLPKNHPVKVGHPDALNQRWDARACRKNASPGSAPPACRAFIRHSIALHRTVHPWGNTRTWSEGVTPLSHL